MKKCVRWQKPVRSLMATIVIAGAATFVVTAETNERVSLPRLEFADIEYVGGFRLPNTVSNGHDFSFGGRQIAFNPAGNSLFVGSRNNRVAEVSIPSLARSSNPAALPFATYLQGFADPTEGALSQIVGEGVRLDSLMVYDNRLIGTASVYYDATNIQRVSHYSRSLRLTEPSFSGWTRVWELGKTGYVSGPMAIIPADWRSALGGVALTGQCCVPVVNRTSWGPSAFAFDPAYLGQSTVDAKPLLYYTGTHATLGTWDSSNPTYGATMTLGGMAAIPGTRTVLYFGANGVGLHCYGNGTADPKLVGTASPDGSHYCYDPTSTDKGSHAYPYRYQIWAYDMNDLAEVKAGTKQPWDVVPYGVWPFDLPTPEPKVRLGGVAYDPSTQTLYLSQLNADKDGYANRALIHALHIKAPQVAEPTSAVAITADKAAPLAAGNEVRFKATPTGGAAPHQYKWMTHDGRAWNLQSGWSSNSDYAMTASAPNASLKVGVAVRSANSVSDEGETSATMDFPIVSSRVTAVSMTSNKTAPQAPGTTITWNATAMGGDGVQYKWWVYDGAWTQVADWSTLSTFAWTPATANAGYRVAVWARSAGSNDVYEATAESYFAIAAPATTTPAPAPAPAPTPTAKVTAIALTPSVAAPQRVNTAITWTATPTGGVAPHQYQWWVFDGVNWVSQPWTTANTFTWKPGTANASYRVAVYVRSAGNTGTREASTEKFFAIVP